MQEISVLIPASKTTGIDKTLCSIYEQEIRDIEIIIIFNGISEQEANEVQARLTLRHINQASRLKFIYLPDANKGAAINVGLRAAAKDVIIVMDVDTIAGRDAFKKVISHFQEPSVMAVGARLKVIDAGACYLCTWQSYEYIKIFLLYRRWFSACNADCIISGAFSSFRKAAILEAGGFAEDCVGEDMEIVLRLQQKYTRPIRYDQSIVCYTSVPRFLSNLLHQRERWQRGLLDCVLKHRSLIMNHRYGYLGILIMPYQVIFELLGPLWIILGIVNAFMDWLPALDIIMSVYVAYMFFSNIYSISHAELGGIITNIVYAVPLTIYGIGIQIVLAIARIYGMVSYIWRPMAW